MKLFDDWFHELEGHCLRSERFYESLTAFNNPEALAQSMRLWLWAAYDMGRQHASEEKQVIIDNLMMEFCPEVMTDEQWKEWAKHQKPVKDLK